jgi:hypothetical protein
VAGARSLDFDAKALPEDQVNHLAYGVLELLKLPKVAVWLFQENVRDYPQSPDAYYGLGDGLLALGDTSSAITQLRRGLAMTKKAGRPEVADVKRKLDTLGRLRTKSP